MSAKTRRPLHRLLALTTLLVCLLGILYSAKAVQIEDRRLATTGGIEFQPGSVSYQIGDCSGWGQSSFSESDDGSTLDFILRIEPELISDTFMKDSPSSFTGLTSNRLRKSLLSQLRGSASSSKKPIKGPNRAFSSSFSKNKIIDGHEEGISPKPAISTNIKAIFTSYNFLSNLNLEVSFQDLSLIGTYQDPGKFINFTLRQKAFKRDFSIPFEKPIFLREKDGIYSLNLPPEFKAYLGTVTNLGPKGGTNEDASGPINSFMGDDKFKISELEETLSEECRLKILGIEKKAISEQIDLETSSLKALSKQTGSADLVDQQNFKN